MKIQFNLAVVLDSSDKYLTHIHLMIYTIYVYGNNVVICDTVYLALVVYTHQQTITNWPPKQPLYCQQSCEYFQNGETEIKKNGKEK